MIRQYLSNINKSAIISILQKFLEVNKALGELNKAKTNKFQALFRCEKILDFANVAFLFVCDKYCPIID